MIVVVHFFVVFLEGLLDDRVRASIISQQLAGGLCNPCQARAGLGLIEDFVLDHFEGIVVLGHSILLS